MQQVEIPSEIAQRAEELAGRRWVLAEVHAWLESSTDRFLLLTGEPGSGKTALAAWLAGAGPALEEEDARLQLRSVRDAWRAAHFCQSEDRRGSLNPERFARSLAAQLTERFEGYAGAVLRRIAPEINIYQEARENWGQMIGAQIDTLIIESNPEDVYNRVVREPLEEICQTSPGLRIPILIDALDEALTYGETNIVTLVAGSGDLPPGVRFFLTSRNEPQVLNQFKRPARIDLSGQQHAADSDSDIRTYVTKRLAEPKLQDAVGGPDGKQSDIDVLVQQAAGNFLYIQFLLDEVAAGYRSFTEQSGLPRGLFGLYRAHLNRIVPEPPPAGTERRWPQFQPVLGTLSVAVPAAPLRSLYEWLDDRDGAVPGRLNEVRQITEYLPFGGGSYRLYHRSMAEFLACPDYLEDEELIPNAYCTPPHREHERIARYYLAHFRGNWSDCDAYGLGQIVSHLQAWLASIRDSEEQRQLAADIYSVVLDPVLRSAQLAKLGTVHPVLADLRLALDLALARGDLVQALACCGAYRTTVRSNSLAEAIFQFIDAGDYAQALKVLEHYPAVPDWPRVLHFYLAWEAAEAGDAVAAARAVAAGRHFPYAQAEGLVESLLVRAARTLLQPGRTTADWLKDWGWGDSSEGLLVDQNSPSSEVTEEKAARWQDLQQRVFEFAIHVDERNPEFASAVPFFDPEGVGLVAARLQELLVEFIDEPAGQECFDQLLTPILLNPYPRYRDIALVALGIVAARTVDPNWARDRLRPILRTALEQEGVTFTFDLPALLLAEAQRRQIAAPELQAYLDQALASDDRWCTALRARCAQASALFALGRTDEAAAELKAAEEEPIGYAGYASVSLLWLANRHAEFGLETDLELLLNWAEAAATQVRSPEFRQDRLALVGLYRNWLQQPVPDDHAAHRTFLALPAGDIRLAYLDYVAARWAWPADNPRRADIATLVPLSLIDGTILDGMLARLVAPTVGVMSNSDLAEAITICARDLTSGRPWDFGEWH